MLEVSRAFCLLALLVVGESTALAADFNLYMAPSGVDTNTGLTPLSPIKTLTRAHELISAKKPASDTVVSIAPGTYLNQRVIWRYTNPAYAITFRSSDIAKKPVFSGCSVSAVTDASTQCMGGIFFLLSSAFGQNTNLTFENIRVETYWMAISLEGRYDNPNSFNANNTITNCTFYKIGNFFNPKLPFSYAAVKLYNSKRNKITFNWFEMNQNASPDYYAYIHSIYAASYSNENVITGNVFLTVTGDAVRLRDFSNNNYISQNKFISAGRVAAYTEWYCRADEGLTCLKTECPSWNNLFINNTYGNGFLNRPLQLSALFQSSTMPGCTAPTEFSYRVSSLQNNFAIQ